MSDSPGLRLSAVDVPVQVLSLSELTACRRRPKQGRLGKESGTECIGQTHREIGGDEDGPNTDHHQFSSNQSLSMGLRILERFFSDSSPISASPCAFGLTTAPHPTRAAGRATYTASSAPRAVCPTRHPAYQGDQRHHTN